MVSVTKRFPKKKDSPYQVRWKDERGKHRAETIKRKKDADAFKRKIEDQIRDGTHVAETITVEKLAEQYLRYQEGRVRDDMIGRGRLEAIRGAMNLAVIPTLGHKKATEVTVADVRAVYDNLRHIRGNSAFSAKLRVKELDWLFDFGISRGALKVNVVPAVLKELRGVVPQPGRKFTIEEVQRILSCAKVRREGQEPRAFEMTRCIVYMAAAYGMRFCEITGLTIQDISFDQMMIKVRHSLTKYNEHKAPKTKAGIRDLWIPPPIEELLRAWMADGYIENERQLVFTTSKGGAIANSSFRREYWMPLLKMAGLEHHERRFKFHALRHFSVSHQIHSGSSPATVSRMHGHANVATTMKIYTHSLDDWQSQQQMVGRAVTNLLGPPEIEATALAPEEPVAQPLRNATQPIDFA